MKDSPNQPSVDVARDLALLQMLRPVAEHMADDAVREIAIPRPGVIFTRVRGQWVMKEDPKLTFDYLEALVSAMASYNNVGFSPIMSLLLPGGERGQVARPPAVLDGTVSINIRKHSTLVKTLDELQAEGAFDNWVDVSGPAQDLQALPSEDRELWELKDQRQMRRFLEKSVQYCRNVIIAGKTGSGKTTFARSLIERVPQSERILTIEDVHELFLPNHPHRVPMFYGTGVGQMTPTAIIGGTMRSSPDRIFLSELRGPEAWDYLDALNTGHPGSITTTHANSARATYNRVGMLVMQSPAGRQMGMDAILQLLHATLNVSLYFANYKLVEVYFNPWGTHASGAAPARA